jgi:hypothetical protein
MQRLPYFVTYLIVLNLPSTNSSQTRPPNDKSAVHQLLHYSLQLSIHQQKTARTGTWQQAAAHAAALLQPLPRRLPSLAQPGPSCRPGSSCRPGNQAWHRPSQGPTPRDNLRRSHPPMASSAARRTASAARRSMPAARSVSGTCAPTPAARGCRDHRRPAGPHTRRGHTRRDGKEGAVEATRVGQ